jgi:cellulose synthase/poly-beta-1,6-N-acetylglucosamine synthase-like glycosyltransferase
LALAIPARNEAARLPGCIDALGAASRRADAKLHIVILVNNSVDETASVVRNLVLEPLLSVELIETELPAERAHAGWARRLAFDAAASHLASGDILLSTDADTVVAEDWLARTLAYFDAGYDGVAGLARLSPRELRSLPTAHRARLSALRRYDFAVSYLKAWRTQDEPWPRHFYEGGASLALTKAAYEEIGGAPTPSVGEDKALFEAVRRIGGKVRHAVDVRVTTSARLMGRAAGGASDTLALWGRLAPDEPIPGVQTIAKNLDLKGSGDGALTFQDLPAEIERARALVRLARQTTDLADVG